jgi:hypothetical protein
MNSANTTEGRTMNTETAIILARKHVHNGAAMQSSAELCLTDAIRLFEAGSLALAKDRAIKSLGYSVGVFHADYARASR